MVKNPVKVYARLRNIKLANEATDYSIRRKEGFDILALNKYAKQRNKYKFHQIFDQSSSQEDVFENTTRPILNRSTDFEEKKIKATIRVLHGFNGTIFAYGQTGSGKTYSMTGCSDDYEKRGIIPRCIQEIFQFTNKSPDQYTIFISYMEIYNEIGYDLLNPKHHATKLEELPRVTLLDDGKGEAHLRNLFKLPVLTEQEAMRLLFLGDTNRTIAETPMNEYSSRSHCIFTIYITRTENERKIRSSKLNLVDLAGSERIYKANISGTTLAEAKNINLSLHYLEQVILALSQSKRNHIPFRNSMMTYMLRDSLSGNSITVMLATLSIKPSNLEETVTTCNFSQRVALVNTDAIINEVFDPQEEINYLRDEITNLRNKFSEPVNIPSTGRKILSEIESGFCKKLTEDYLETGIWHNNTTLNLEQCIKCFEIFRDLIVNQKSNMQINQESIISAQEYVCTKNDIVEKFKDIVKQKDEEIDILTQLLEAYDLSKNQNSCNSNITSPSMKSSPRSKQSEESEVEELESPASKQRLFEEFLNENNNSAQIKNLKAHIESKCQLAEQITEFVESCQENIIRLRRKLEIGYGISDSAYIAQIQSSLKSQQDVYAKSIENMKQIKEETDFLEHGLKQEYIRLEQNFKHLKEDRPYNPQHSIMKTTSECGIFTRLNESFKNMERKLSAKVKIQTKKLSPKKSESEPCINIYETKRSNTFISNEEKSYSKGEANTNPHRKKVHAVNSQVEISFTKTTSENALSAQASKKYISAPIKEAVNKKHIKRQYSTAKMMPSSSASPEKWDYLKMQQDEFYSSIGERSNKVKHVVSPINTSISSDETEHRAFETSSRKVDKKANNLITTLPDLTTSHSFDIMSNQNTNRSSLGVEKRKIGKHSKKVEPSNIADNFAKNSSNNSSRSEVKNIAFNCMEYQPELRESNEDLSTGNNSDSSFERKMQSYLKKIPMDPRKDTHLDNVSNTCEITQSKYITNSRNTRQVSERAHKMHTEASLDSIKELISKVTQVPNNYRGTSSEENSKQANNLGEFQYGRYKRTFYERDVGHSTNVNTLLNSNVHKQTREDIVQMNDCYNKQVEFSDQTKTSNYVNNVSKLPTYKRGLQEEHIPEKDSTICHHDSSFDERQQPDQQPNKAKDNQNNLFIQGDSTEFIEFMQTIPLTGDTEVDEEIVKFYRTKFTRE